MSHSLGRLLATILLVALVLPVSAATLSWSHEPPPLTAAVASPSPAPGTTRLALQLATTQDHDPRPTPDTSATAPDVLPTPDPPKTGTDEPDVSEAPSSTTREELASPAKETPAPKPTVEEPVPSTPKPASLSKTEARLLELLNAERRAAGLRALEPARDLVRIARDWSQVMSSTGNFRHNPGLTGLMCCRSAFGENVAWGGVPDGWLMESTDGIHRNFMRSPGHRANILDPRFDQVGIGTVVANGKIWVTQVFRRYAG